MAASVWSNEWTKEKSIATKTRELEDRTTSGIQVEEEEKESSQLHFIWESPCIPTISTLQVAITPP